MARTPRTCRGSSIEPGVEQHSTETKNSTENASRSGSDSERRDGSARLLITIPGRTPRARRRCRTARPRRRRCRPRRDDAQCEELARAERATCQRNRERGPADHDHEHDEVVTRSSVSPSVTRSPLSRPTRSGRARRAERAAIGGSSTSTSTVTRSSTTSRRPRCGRSPTPGAAALQAPQQARPCRDGERDPEDDALDQESSPRASPSACRARSRR